LNEGNFDLSFFIDCVGSVMLFISSLAPSVGVANLSASFIILFSLLFAGFFVNVDSLDGGVYYLSYLWYSFENILSNELSGLLFNIEVEGVGGAAISGELFLNAFGMSHDNLDKNLIILGAIAFGMFLCGWFVLWLRVQR